jgi:hypothetical protein
MTNLRIEAAYQRTFRDFREPPLSLLHGRHAPFVVTALSLIFTADRPTVAVTDAHVEVEDMVTELRDAGFDDDGAGLPAGNGRRICSSWVRSGWLVRQIGGNRTGAAASATSPGAADRSGGEGAEVYRLSAQAVGALETAGRVGGGRARVSQSRIRTLLDSVDQLAQDAETDPESRLAALQADRDRIDAEMAALRAGKMPVTDDEQLREEAENILHLSRELPADFARVAESIDAMQRDVVTELRRDVRPVGEVLREYLHRGQHVMEATPEGRAFAGAMRLIGDQGQIDRLTDQLTTLLIQPFVALMSPHDRGELAAVAKRVEQGVQAVLSAQRRASHVITAQVQAHDPVRDREVDDLLRGVMSGLQAWLPFSRAGEAVEPLRGFPTAAVGHLRQTLADLRPPDVPVPLRHEDAPVLVEDDTRDWGGPHYDELEDVVAGSGAPEFDLAGLFDGADERLRRPVDLLGMLEIAYRNGMVDRDEVSVVEAVRPDGTRRRFAFGAVTGQRTSRGEARGQAQGQEDMTQTEETE